MSCPRNFSISYPNSRGSSKSCEPRKTKRASSPKSFLLTAYYIILLINLTSINVLQMNQFGRCPLKHSSLIALLKASFESLLLVA